MNGKHGEDLYANLRECFLNNSCTVNQLKIYHLKIQNMTVKSLAFLVATAFTCGVASAQPTTPPTVVEDFKPSAFNQPFQAYPQVNSQGYARFRIHAPNADSVRVSLGWGGQPGGTKLTKADSGYFIGTTAGPLDEGFHYYHLNVDGGTFNDP